MSTPSLPIPLNQLPAPAFILHQERLIRNLEKITAFSGAAGIDVIFALKACGMHAAFPIIRKYLKGTTASGLYEARLGAENFGGEIHVFSPAYSDDDIGDILDFATHVSFNSLSQWERFADKVSARDVIPYLRVNPEYSDVETDMYNPCIPGSRLGIRHSQLPKKLPKGIQGLHFHNLCESKAEALVATLASFDKHYGHLLNQVTHINMGGGHLITHQDYHMDKALEAIRAFKKKYPHLHLNIEPGAAVVWDSGYLSANVLDIIDSRGIKVLMLDISIAAHMPDCLEMPYKAHILGSLPPEGAPFVYRLGGSTCLAGDFMGDYGFEQPIKVGDKILFNDMIHYTMVKTSMFNGVKHPEIGIWSDAKERYRRVRTFDYKDYYERLS